MGMLAEVFDGSHSFVLVALAGGAGCAARVAVREALVVRGVSASVAILGVNLLGAGLAGAVAGGVGDPGSFGRSMALAVLSGWTTYSAFSADVFVAVRDGRLGRAALLWGGTIVAAPAIAQVASRLVAGGPT